MRTDPPTLPRNLEDPEEHVEQLLRAFFQAELPDPFPGWKLPNRKPTPAARRRGRWFGSRLALAASVAFILVGSLAVNSRFPSASTPAPRGLDGPTFSNLDRIAGPVTVITDAKHRAKVLERHEGPITVIEVERLPDLPKD